MLFPFLRPDLPRPQEWVHFLDSVYDQRYFSNFGALASRLADLMAAAYLAPGYQGLLCASNTAGLTAVLQALHVAGRKVVLPDFTFAATPQAIFSAGATPVICDIDPESWELSAESVRSALAAHPDIAAVVYVRPFGLIRDISAIRAVCAEHGLPLLIDAAAGLGAPSDGALFGSDLGEIEVFSLHATKVFAVGEGGFIAAPATMIQKIKAAMNFGFNTDRTYREGQNAKFDEFRAAIGLAMLEKMDAIVPIRKAHAAFYDELFNAIGGCKTARSSGPTPWSTYPVVFDRPVTATTLGTFADNGIEIKKYYWPGVQRGYVGGREMHVMDLTQSLAIQDRCACFPIYSDFSSDTGRLLGERAKNALSLRMV
jgi:dTDP-4-amino-4,6-dideoxygalactose transaminase